MKLNIFKKEKKKQATGRKSTKSLSKKEEKPSSEDSRESVSEQQLTPPSGSFGSVHQIISHPLITEKATSLEILNQYVFKVWPASNKIQIRQAIEGLYKVKVEKIRIIKLPSKKRKLGRWEGEKSGFKKAIVKLQPGHKIEIAK